jgi:peptide/nickel transport system substrate-binding protein
MKSRKILNIALLASLMGLGMFSIYAVGDAKGQTTETAFIFGTANGPADWDPHVAWDSASIDVLLQIVEGLYTYDYTNESAPLVRLLAVNESWDVTNTNLTVILKQNVTFHDGTPFNATAAKWNFDRLNFLCNTSAVVPAPFSAGNISTVGVSQLQELYVTPTHEPTIKEVVVNDNYNITIVLTEPYGPFQDLLAFMGSGMFSPTSTPATDYIDISAGQMPVGTGPFMFNSQATDDYVRLHKYANYHGTPAKVDIVYFDIINDAQTRNNAILAKEIHFLDDPLPDMWDSGIFHNDTGLQVNDGPDSLAIQYVGMNNKNINKTLRQALSWSFNYTYYLDEVMAGTASRLHGPLPSGMKFVNDSIPYVDMMNLSKARAILIADGAAPASAAGQETNDTYWTNLAATAPIGGQMFQFTYNNGNDVRQQVGTLLKAGANLVGMDIIVNGTDWGNYLDMLYNVSGARAMLDLYAIGWGPDFNDPDNYMRPLFWNTSASNGANVNDPDLQANMSAGIATTNATERAQIYGDIQYVL